MLYYLIGRVSHSIFFFNLKQYEIKFENALYENSRWLNRPFSIYIFLWFARGSYSPCD